MPSERSRPEQFLSADPDLKWAAEVGRFVLAFGGIEHTSIVCLHALPRDTIAAATMNMPLGQRLHLLAELLQGRKGENAYDDLAGILLRIREFVGNRNLVAHNPLLFSFYQSDAGGVIIRPEIVSTRNRERRLTFDALVEMADTAERLAADFSLASFAVYGNDPDLYEQLVAE
jgi:hypothetical protein